MKEEDLELKRTESRVKEWMASEGVKRILPKLQKARSLPANYDLVIRELESPNGSLSKAAAVIAQDPVMSAKILQAVNSAFCALTSQVTDPVEAIFHLGTEQVKGLILVANAFNQFTEEQMRVFPLEEIWRHSIVVASFARTIANEEALGRATGDAAWTAGLLHDIGKPLLAGNMPKEYRVVCEEPGEAHLEEREWRHLGTTHAEIGACVLAKWNIPCPLLEAVAYHHRPSKSDDSSATILTAVHAANVLAHEKARSSDARFDAEYLRRIGLTEAPQRWRESLGLSAKPQ